MKNIKVTETLSALIFGVTIFLGAFLLFQVQPLIGRFLLPWFGGTPEVWTTCMLFFQVFLLLGYAYAHWLNRLRSPRLKAIIHVALLAAALFFLPILPEETLKPTAETVPVLQILLICTVTVGLPYMLLAATSPLTQAWFARALPGRNPYRLYALSNTGSLLGLASFPFVFEPLFSRIQMVRLWSIAFVVFAALCAAAVWTVNRRHWAESASAIREPHPDSKPTVSRWGLWLALPAVASVELLAVTNKITQDVAVIPFLWVLPLGVYLLSFILCFEHQRWYRRWLFVPLFIAGIIGIIYVHLREEFMGAGQIIGLHVFMLFACAMVCHGELYRLRPAPRHLTAYYLLIAAGGAAGGIFVAVICPLIFNVYIELNMGLGMCACCLLLAETDVSPAYRKRRYVWIAALIMVGLTGIFSMGKRTQDNQRSIENERNFFGVLTIWEENWDHPDKHILLMQHGTTFHGLQFQSPQKRDIPTAYYSPNSGIGLTLQYLPKQQDRKIGIVGLGVGTIAVYGRKTDTVRFYEINPAVERLARKYFTYLQDCAADVEVVLGDARLTMENEPPQGFDVLVVDAFSSDAVPVHLLTTEAMEVYLKHLAPEGVLAFHISTMHLDLQSVVWKLAEHFGLETAWIEGYEDDDTGALSSDWILLARNDDFLKSQPIDKAVTPPGHHRKDIMLWTDDHINLLEILKKNPLSN